MIVQTAALGPEFDTLQDDTEETQEYDAKRSEILARL